MTPLFRELLFRLATRPADYDRKGPGAKLVSVLLHELTTVAVENHRLPMPSDPRLRRPLDAMTADAAKAATIKEWAKQVGVGDKTLSRLLLGGDGTDVRPMATAAPRHPGDPEDGARSDRGARGRGARVRERERIRHDVSQDAWGGARELHGGAVQGEVGRPFAGDRR